MKCSARIILSLIFLAVTLPGRAVTASERGWDTRGDVTTHGSPIRMSQSFVRDREENKMRLSLEEDSKIVSEPLPDQILEDIRQIEFNEIKYDEGSTNYYGVIEGKIPILISAPHGAKHFRRRENRWKGEDEYTASLAIELGQLTGAYVIYVKNKTKEDPNNDAKSKYKMAVARIVKDHHIKFLVDLHGSDETRPFKVDVGIISGKSGRGSCPRFKKIVREVFSDFEPKIFNKEFCASDPCTLTSFARSKLGIEAAQVEINAKYRIVERKPDSTRAKKGIDPHFKANGKDVLALVTRLKRMILEIDQKIEKETLAKCEQAPPTLDH